MTNINEDRDTIRLTIIFKFLIFKENTKNKIPIPPPHRDIRMPLILTEEENLKTFIFFPLSIIFLPSTKFI